MEEELKDIHEELNDLLSKVQPNLQDVIKRGFTNVCASQMFKNGDLIKPVPLEDVTFFSKNTQVNLFRLEIAKPPTFHVHDVSLDLKCMNLSLRCSYGELNVRGLYRAYNENLFNVIPVISEGHLLVTLSNLAAEVKVGLSIEDDLFTVINPGINFTHDEVISKLTWPSPQRNGGYEFTTTEQIARHIDDLPVSACVAGPLWCELRRRLDAHLQLVLRHTIAVSDLLDGRPPLCAAYSENIEKLAMNANKVMDMVLINVRRTLLQGRKEVLSLPPLQANFTHKIGSVTLVGRFETDAGWIQNLATVNRINDVSTKVEPNAITYYVTLRIKDFRIGFNEYRVKWAGGGGVGGGGGGGGGRLVLTVADSALQLALQLGSSPQPYAQLLDLSFSRVHGLELHAPGVCALGGSGAAREAGAWLAGVAHAHAAPLVRRQLAHELQAALTELDLHTK